QDVFLRGGCRPESLCLACSLFGLMGRRSRLSVQDLQTQEGMQFSIENMPQLFSPRPHHLGYFSEDRRRQQLTVTKLRGRKFHQNGGPVASGKTEPVEAILSETLLKSTLSFVNASPEELGAVLTALGWTPKSFLKIGSGKAHGFGQMRLQTINV